MRERQLRENSHGLLLFAVGALAGAAAGVYAARRFRNRQEFFDALRTRLVALRTYWNELDELEENGEAAARTAAAAPEGEEDELEWDDVEGDDASYAVSGAEHGARFEKLPREGGGEKEGEEVGNEERERSAVAGVPERPRRSRTSLLATQVLGAFERDPVLQARAIDIAMVGDTVVELTGWVRSVDDAVRAAAVARRVPGISMVLNRLGVKGAGDVDPDGVSGEPVGESEVAGQRSEVRGLRSEV